MKIHEHEPGAVVRIVPRIGDAFCFESYILPPIQKDAEGYILIEPMENENGKYLRFNGLPCVLEIEAKDSECVYRYEISKMGYIRWKCKDYFVVYSDSDVGIYNRRSQYRVPFTTKGQLQVGRHTRVYNCYLHDVSINGLSVSVRGNKDFKCDIGSTVSVFFNKDTEHVGYKVDGVTVRSERKGDNMDFTSLGIYVENPTRSWTGFVSRLQREELQRRSSERKSINKGI